MALLTLCVQELHSTHSEPECAWPISQPIQKVLCTHPKRRRQGSHQLSQGHMQGSHQAGPPPWEMAYVP